MLMMVIRRWSLVIRRWSLVIRRWSLAVGLVVGVALVARGSQPNDAVARGFQPSDLLWDTGTFSILGYDPQTGEVGGAVQSRVFSVGNGVLWSDANVGVAATQ